MGITVKIPYYLRQITDTNPIVEVNGLTVLECLKDLIRRYPRLKGAVFDERGNLLLKWMVYLNDKPILRSSALSNSVENNDMIGLFPITPGG